MKLITSVLAVLALGMTLSFAADEKKEGEKKKVDPAEAFKKLDANNDGKVSEEEFAAKAKDPAKAKEAFAKLDANKDGSLSVEEFSARAKKGDK